MTCPGTCGRLPPPFSPPPSPRFSELLSMNAPPLDAEVAGLRQIIHDSSAYIDFLQSQIAKVQETLSSLKGLQENAACIMADTQKILHPMRSLPQDILVEIFLCCTPIVDHYETSWPHGDDSDSLSPLNHPWSLSQVSHRWREIALSLPRLWSVIYLNFTRYTSHSALQRCSFMGPVLFARSAKLDLCINIASGEMDIGDHLLMPLLKENTTRWRTLYAHMSSPSLQSLSGCEFPLLQELGVRDENPGDLDDVSVDTFKDVQNVRILRIYPSHDSAVQGYETLGEFPWSKLSKMACLSSTIHADFLPCLEQLSCLEELTITLDIIVSSFWRELSGRVIILPALKRLEVTNYGHGHQDANIEQLLHNLQIPSVCCLTVAFAIYRPLHYSPLVPHPDFHRISILRVTCSMTQPSILSSYIGGTATLLDFLRPMSGVVQFRLKDRSVTSEFLDGLVAEKGTVLLPSLTTLDLHECGFADHHETLKSIRRIVESRALNHALEKIVLPQEDWLNELSTVDGLQGILIRQKPCL